MVDPRKGLVETRQWRSSGCRRRSRWCPTCQGSMFDRNVTLQSRWTHLLKPKRPVPQRGTSRYQVNCSHSGFRLWSEVPARNERIYFFSSFFGLYFSRTVPSFFALPPSLRSHSSPAALSFSQHVSALTKLM